MLNVTHAVLAESMGLSDLDALLAGRTPDWVADMPADPQPEQSLAPAEIIAGEQALRELARGRR